MSYVNMREMLATARKEGRAVGAFNITNYGTAIAVVRAAQAAGVPVILQTSTSTVKQIGASALISFLRPMAEAAPMPVAAHLDHCTDAGLVKQCIDAGWSSVMYDGSKEPFERNLATTAGIVKYAAKRDVTVEGELGAITGVEDDLVVTDHESLLADPVKSVEFVEATGVDAFAPAIGTAHGLYKTEPKIDFDRFATIAAKVRCALVLHGGTGLSREVFRRLIKLGASKVNVSTAIKIAYVDGAFEYIGSHRDEYNPLRVDRHIESAVQLVVQQHIDIFRCGE